MNTLTKTSIESLSIPKESTLDIFAFEDDRLRRLDSYQRIEKVTSNTIGVSSTGGNKIFFLCINGQRSRYDWALVNSYSSLSSIFCDLENESVARRTMTAEVHAMAGKVPDTCEITPLSCEIVIGTLGCDFSGTPYAKSVIKDLKAYLTNVCATCPILYTNEYRPNRIINTGCLNPADVSRFKNPDIIVQEITGQLGMETIHPDIRLLCYPNPAIEETPGSPHTRLVIEGEIDSQTYYWPVTINKGTGINKGDRHIYDILIRRKGVTDPDIPIDGAETDIQLKIKPWTEKEEYSVDF